MFVMVDFFNAVRDTMVVVIVVSITEVHEDVVQGMDHADGNRAYSLYVVLVVGQAVLVLVALQGGDILVSHVVSGMPHNLFSSLMATHGRTIQVRSRRVFVSLAVIVVVLHLPIMPMIPRGKACSRNVAVGVVSRTVMLPAHDVDSRVVVIRIVVTIINTIDKVLGNDREPIYFYQGK